MKAMKPLGIVHRATMSTWLAAGSCATVSGANAALQWQLIDDIQAALCRGGHLVGPRLPHILPLALLAVDHLEEALCALLDEVKVLALVDHLLAELAELIQREQAVPADKCRHGIVKTADGQRKAVENDDKCWSTCWCRSPA